MNQTLSSTENPMVMVACTNCGEPFQMPAIETKPTNTCPACQNFDAIMWGWLTPAHVVIAEHEQRTGEIPVA